jgi:hypothetical protein
MLTMLWVSVALAADPLSACCAAARSASCPAEWTVTGPDTRFSASPNPDGGAPLAVASGLWRVTCNSGARFSPAATASFPFQPSSGTSITAVDAAGAACFDAACALPPDLCATFDGTVGRIAPCNGVDRPEAWTQAPEVDSVAAVLDGRVVRVTLDAPSTSPQPPPDIDATVPPTPEPAACRAPAAARGASSEQVDAGDAALLAGNAREAMSRYRAAITLNACNPFAWVGLGLGLLDVRAPRAAANALRTATSLQPNHYAAWTDLGRAEEASGRRAEAADAYRRALLVKPDYTPAIEGAARTR